MNNAIFFNFTWNYIFLYAIVSVQTADKSAETTNNLTILVIGLKGNAGNVVIKLFNSKESYSTKGAKAFMEKSAEIKDQKAKAAFTDFMPGEYAIKLYHDKNGNGKHDKNFLGIPKEDYTFSNNAIGAMGPPK